MKDVIEDSILLYKLSKTGSTLQFHIIARKVLDGAVLITRKGTVEGTVTEDIETVYPRNVGRANETTPFEQAKLMMRSKSNKLQDKGYKRIPVGVISLTDIRKYLSSWAGTDASGNLLPMLAQKNVARIKYPGYIQRKFDGMRAIANPSEMRTRNGKPLSNLSHILADLPELPEGWWYDGELYHHDRSLQQIVSMVKRAQPGNKEIQYRIYDLVNTGLPFKARKRALNRILRTAGPSVVRTKTYLVDSKEAATDLFTRFLEEGYEGAMWRDPDGIYECGTRSWGLIKIKPFDEDEFEIIGVNEATGRDIGTAIFVCKTKSEEEFTVRPIGTREVRREYFNNFEEKYLGKMLTVRFQGYTDRGVPHHHRAIVVRDYD